jgi:hypothetical protein
MSNSEPFVDFPDDDSEWSEDQWSSLLHSLVDDGLANWAQITSLVLGHLNPSQVGTSMTKEGFKRQFPPRQCWRNVREWHFVQNGMCADCGTRLELQADHMVSKEVVGKVAEEVATAATPNLDPVELQSTLRTAIDERLDSLGVDYEASDDIKDAICADLASLIVAGASTRSELALAADRTDNMILRCRRCNVIRRPSHKHGGKEFLTTESALMWILLVKRPATYERFHALCRGYGMTMADIRFQEAWAMARWLSRIGQYEIAPDSKHNGE